MPVAERHQRSLLTQGECCKIVNVNNGYSLDVSQESSKTVPQSFLAVQLLYQSAMENHSRFQSVFQRGKMKKRKGHRR